MKNKYILFLLFNFAVISAIAQTALSTGDIAFVGMNQDGSDDFSFILLKDITANTAITFTDKGWQSTGGFIINNLADCNSENTIIWTAGTSLTTGKIVTILGFTAMVDGASNGTVVASPSNCPDLTFSSSGESLFAYQGAAPTVGNETSFLAAINMHAAWDAEATSTTTSAKPSVFTDGVNSLSILAEVDNAVYKGSLTGTVAALRSRINDVSNWITDNITAYNLPDDIGPDASAAPVVTAVNVPVDGTYRLGHHLDFTINFDQNITVDITNGTPQLALTIGSTTQQAIYQSGSGTSSLVFRYTVQSGDQDTDGIAVGTLSANSGTLKDAAGNDADLTLTNIGSTAGVIVDGTPPLVLPYIEDFEGNSRFSLSNSSGINAASSNVWQINDDEGGVAPNGCGLSDNGDKTLHITCTSQFCGSLITGAVYNAAQETNVRAESPTIINSRLN